MEGRLRPLGSPRGLDSWDLATYVVLTHPWALAALIVGLPLLRGCGGALVAALRCTERSTDHGLAISAHWSPPAWREALLACGLDPSIASHQRAAMRRVVIALWTWHLLAPSIALLSVALFSDRLPPAYRLGAACVGARACLHLATTPLLLLTRPAFFLADLHHTWTKGGSVEASIGCRMPAAEAMARRNGMERSPPSRTVMAAPMRAHAYALEAGGEAYEQLRESGESSLAPRAPRETPRFAVLLSLIAPELFALLALSNACGLPLGSRQWSAAVHARTAEVASSTPPAARSRNQSNTLAASSVLAVRTPLRAPRARRRALSCCETMGLALPVGLLPLALLALLAADAIASHAAGVAVWSWMRTADGGRGECESNVAARFRSALVAPFLCTNECSLANDGECDDGGDGAEYAYRSCILGSDCDDCGLRAPEGIEMPAGLLQTAAARAARPPDLGEFVRSAVFAGVFSSLSPSQQLSTLSMLGGAAFEVQPTRGDTSTSKQGPWPPVDEPSQASLWNLVRRVDAIVRSLLQLQPPPRLLIAPSGCTDAASCFSCTERACEEPIALRSTIIPACFQPKAGGSSAVDEMMRGASSPTEIVARLRALHDECSLSPPEGVIDMMAQLACDESAPPPPLLAAFVLVALGVVVLLWRGCARAGLWERLGTCCYYLCCCCFCCCCDDTALWRVWRRSTSKFTRCCRLCCLPEPAESIDVAALAAAALGALDGARASLQSTIHLAKTLQNDPEAERRAWELAATVSAAAERLASPQAPWEPEPPLTPTRTPPPQSSPQTPIPQSLTSAARHRAARLSSALALMDESEMSRARGALAAAVVGASDLEEVLLSCDVACRLESSPSVCVLRAAPPHNRRASGHWAAAMALRAAIARVDAVDSSATESIHALCSTAFDLRCALEFEPLGMPRGDEDAEGEEEEDEEVEEAGRIESALDEVRGEARRPKDNSTLPTPPPMPPLPCDNSEMRAAKLRLSRGLGAADDRSKGPAVLAAVAHRDTARARLEQSSGSSVRAAPDSTFDRPPRPTPKNLKGQPTPRSSPAGGAQRDSAATPPMKLATVTLSPTRGYRYSHGYSSSGASSELQGDLFLV